MKRAALCIILFLPLAQPLFAMDEDAYVSFVADSVIIAHKHKGDPGAQKQWAREIAAQHPGVTAQDIKLFEAELAGDARRKERVYGRILENLKSKKHKAHMEHIDTGSTKVVIEDQ